MPLKLVRPTHQYAGQVMEYRKEMLAHHDSFDGCAGLENVASFDEWIDFEDRLRRTYSDGYVPSEVFLGVRTEDDKVVGIIDYRHPLTPFLLQYGGNIGYSVLPSERRKGYAREMLRLILPVCRAFGDQQVLLTCDKTNEASRRTITGNGGVLENEVADDTGPDGCGIIQRYWIPTGGSEDESGQAAMSGVIFDTARKADIPELVRLRIAYVMDDWGTVSNDERRCMEEQLPDYFERRLNRELFAFVARSEGRLVATAYLLVTEKPANPSLPNGLDGEVLSVYTEIEYRGRGIGTQLIKNLITYAKERRLCRIGLKATDGGYPLYKRLGFEDRVEKYRDMRLKL